MTEPARTDLDALLAELGRLLGRAAPGSLPGMLRCGGAELMLFHDEAADPHHLQAYVDLGPVPPSRQHEVFRRLLLAHAQLVVSQHAIVGLDGDSGRVVLVVRIRLDAGLDAARLATMLQQLVRQVLTWRRPVPPSRMARRTLRRLC